MERQILLPSFCFGRFHEFLLGGALDRSLLFGSVILLNSPLFLFIDCFHLLFSWLLQGCLLEVFDNTRLADSASVSVSVGP